MTNKALTHMKQKERDARRRLIVDAARNLFAKKDFREVTIREIAKAAGVSIGTIYNYYTDMTELFLAIFLQNVEEITEILDNLAANGVPTLDRFCKTYITYLNDNMTFYQMMGHFMLGGEVSGAAAEKLNQTMKRLMDRMDKILRSAKTGNRHQRITSHALFSALNGIMISYARYPGRSRDEIRRHTLRLAGVVAVVFGNKQEPPILDP